MPNIQRARLLSRYPAPHALFKSLVRVFFQVFGMDMGTAKHYAAQKPTKSQLLI
jgi:hypothetical protein